MKAGLYIRVSTEMQARDGESLAEQEATTQAFCNFRNIPIITLYREEGKSGKDTNRPQFQEMLRDCKKGIIDTVVVKKIDRLSRSLMDFEKTVSFFEAHNINLISIQENFDTSTAIGRAVIRIILTFAQLEREQISERTADVIKYRAEQGMWNGGRPPLGYEYDKEIGLVINVEQAKVVIIIFNKYIELASYKKVAEYLNKAGYHNKEFTNRWGKKSNRRFIDTSIANILKNPLYIGKIKHKGELYQGKHKPIVSEDIYTQVQEIIKRNDKRKASINKQNKHNFLLEGLVTCGECGSIMTPRWCVSRNKKRYFYYGCGSVTHTGTNACSIKTISAHVLEQVILTRIRAISKDEELLQRVIDHNEQHLKKEIDELENRRMLLKLRLKEIEEKADNLVSNISLLPQLGNLSFVNGNLQKLEKEKEDITQEIEQITCKKVQLNNRVVNKNLVKESFQHFNNIYHQLSPYLKRYIVKLLIMNIVYNKDSICINYYETEEIKRAACDNLRLSFGATPDWLRVEHSKQKILDYFNIDTYKGSRGKYCIKISG